MPLGPLPTVEQAAVWVRRNFQKMMGSLDGWPYNANLASGAYFYLELQSMDDTQPMVPLPVDIGVSVYGAGTSTGKAAGSAQMTQQSQIVSAAGSIYRTMDYFVDVTYSLPKSLTSFTQTYGTYSGQAMSSQANPLAIVVKVNDFPYSIKGAISVTNYDGTPAGGVFVILDITPKDHPEAPITRSLSGYTPADGTFVFGQGVDLALSETYSVAALVYPSQGSTTLLAQGTWGATGALLTAGGFTEALTLPKPGYTINAGQIHVSFIHGGGLIASEATYTYTITKGDEELAKGSGTSDTMGRAKIAAPDHAKYGDGDILTLNVTGTWEGHEGSGVADNPGLAFDMYGIALTVSVWSGGTPPPHGR